MPLLTPIPLSALPTIYATLRDAPVGALVQMRYRKPKTDLVGGMHCMQQTAAGDVHGVLILDGPDAGTTVREAVLRSGALDVSKALALCVSEPAPEPPAPDREPTTGRLYYDAATQSAYMRVTLTGTGWVCVFDTKDEKVGELFGTIRSDLVDLGAPCLEPIQGK
jgi:hypothetical protein